MDFKYFYSWHQTTLLLSIFLECLATFLSFTGRWFSTVYQIHCNCWIVDSKIKSFSIFFFFFLFKEVIYLFLLMAIWLCCTYTKNLNILLLKCLGLTDSGALSSMILHMMKVNSIKHSPFTVFWIFDKMYFKNLALYPPILLTFSCYFPFIFAVYTIYNFSGSTFQLIFL